MTEPNFLRSRWNRGKSGPFSGSLFLKRDTVTSENAERKLKRILIIKTSSLGDLFHALPAVHALKEELHAEIDWVVADTYADLVRCFDDVDHVIPFPRREFWSRLGWFRRKLREREYDYIVDLQGLIKSAVICRLASGRKRIGPSFHREGSWMFYNVIAGDRNKERHAIDECYDIVRYFGLSVPDVPEFPMTFPKIDMGFPRPRVAMVPCSRWETKNWPAEKFIEVGKSLAEMGVNLVLLGSPEDKPVCRDIERGIGRNVENLCAKTRLVDLGSVLQEMDLVITVDSGPMHFAAALGRPILAIFGATDPDRTGPYGKHCIVKHGRLVCQPCLSRECIRPKRDIACMKDLPAQRVIDAAVQILAP
jgi:lipopolysaccharide heptosyltransferase I